MSTKKIQIIGGIVPQSDWNEIDETSAAYVKNKPFGRETTETVLLPLDNYTFSYNSDLGDLCYLAGVQLEKDITYRIVFDSQEFITKPKFSRLFGSDGLAIGNFALFDSSLESTGEPFLYGSYPGLGMHGFILGKGNVADETHSISIDIPEEVIHKIDPEFIELLSGSVNEDTIAIDAIDTNHIKSAAVTTEKIGSAAVTTEKIANNAVTTEKIGSAAVTTEKIGSAAVTTEKIANNAVTTKKIGSAAVTTEKIGSAAVTTEKIANNAVTDDQIANGNLSHLKFKPLRLINKSEITENVNEILVNFNSTELKKYHHFCTVGEIISADTSATEQVFLFGIKRYSSNVSPTNAIIRASLDLSNNTKYSFVHFVKRYYIGVLGSANALYESELFIYDKDDTIVFHDKKISYYVDSKSVDFGGYDWIGIRTYLLKANENGILSTTISFAPGTNMATYLIEGI